MLHRHYPAFGKACFCILFALFLLVGGICKGQPKITVAITNPTCAYNNGGFVVSVTGGTPPYGFVSNAAHIGNTTGVFGGLAAGSYDLTVTDGKGKQDTTTVVLTGPGTFPYFTSSVVNATGCNANNGQVTLTPAGGTPPYQYSINDGASFQTSNIFGNLSPGTYSILIEDANGCITAPWSAVGESYANFQLWSHASFVHVAAANCPLSINATPSAPACGNNNSITISNTSGGTPPYLYSIDGGAAGPLSGGGFSGLAPGQHTVTVRDASGLVASYTYTFPNDCPITTTETPSDCAGSTGTLTVTAASGIPPLTYSINGVNFQAGNTFNNLAAGTYTVLARDAHGAVTYGFGTVVAVCFGANASTSPSQCDASTGSITAKGIHGFPPYTYSIDGVHFQASGVFSNLKGGYYQVTVKDSHGQKAATTAVVDDQCITLAANPQTASCGKANGTLTVTAGGGTEPYKYSIYAGSYYQKSNVFTGLLPGYYVVTVADANGNLATIASVVTNIEGPQVSAVPTAASCLNNDGQIQVLTTGGASPFMVNFDGRGYYDGQTRWTGLPKGVYSVAVMDNNGCQDSTTVLVALDDTMAVTTDSVPTICQGVAVALPAKSNYNGVSFAWTPSQGLNDDHLAEPVATPSTTTTYTVTATLGACSHADSIAVTVIPAPVATTGPPDTVCPGKSVQLQGAGGVQYRWWPATYLTDSTVANPMVQQPVSTVSYHLTVTGANGCQSLDSAVTTVVVARSPKVFAGNDTAVVVGQPLQLNAQDVDSSGFSSYVWSPAEGLSDPNIANPTLVVMGDVTYTVLATTPLGCTATDTIEVGAATTAGIIVPNAFTPNNDGHNDVLKVNGFGIQSLKYFRVYNRFGQLVFATSAADEGWNGYIGGQPAPAGTYVWMAAGINYKGLPVEGRGTAILIR